MKQLFTKLKPLFLTFLLFSGVLHAQGPGNWWYFGLTAGLDFTNGAPVAVTNGALSTQEGVATISDVNGNLLFYTDGIRAWTKNHVQMPNGTGMMGNPSTTQSAVIVPRPGSSSIYYIFTQAATTNANGFRYSEVDMTLNSGNGDVTSNKNILLNTPSCEKITAVKHCNQVDIWVIAHDWNSNQYRAYLVTSSGVSSTPVLSAVGTTFSGNIANTLGYLKPSPDGSRLASATYTANIFEIVKFNSLTGVCSSPITFPNTYTQSYGVEFSPDGTRLYGTTMSPSSQLWQWDLCAGTDSAIFASATVLATNSTLYHYGAVQLGQDGKLYVARFGQPWLGVINNPNTLGTGCNYVDQGITLNGKNSQWGLPNFIQSYFAIKPAIISVIDTVNCRVDSFKISSTIQQTCATKGDSINSVFWNFGDPSSGNMDTTSVLNPVHTFTSAGTFNVVLIIKYNCSTDTIKTAVTIQNCGPAVTVLGGGVCPGGCRQLIANSNGGTPPYTYSWTPNIGTGAGPHTVCPSATTVYSVTVTDSLGQSTVSQATVVVYPPLVVIDSITNIMCNGNPNGSASALVSGGTSSYTYSWSNGQTTQTATGLGAGNYTVSVTDSKGCTQSRTVTVVQPSPLLLTATGNSVNCTDDTTASASANVSGGVGPYTYSWSNGATTVNITGILAGNYTVMITDVNGCTKLQVVNVTIMTKPKAVASGNPTTGQVPLNVIFTNGSTGGVSYSWNFGDGNSSNSMNSSNTYTNGGTYTVMMIVTAANGCKDTAYITVIADGFSEIIVPNVFSPNGDGYNEVFSINSIGLKDLYVEIYDRWGLKMSDFSSLTGGWDGKSASGKDAPEGTYYYVLKAHGNDNKEYDLKGYLMLMRGK